MVPILRFIFQSQSVSGLRSYGLDGGVIEFIIEHLVIFPSGQQFGQVLAWFFKTRVFANCPKLDTLHLKPVSIIEPNTGAFHILHRQSMVTPFSGLAVC